MQLRCPGCDLVFETATSLCGPAPMPVPGARTVCTGCTAVGVFVNGPLGVYVRAATEAEAADWRAR